jgi:hypothetical protein
MGSCVLCETIRKGRPRFALRAFLYLFYLSMLLNLVRASCWWSGDVEV